jgi:hypothetical protein
VNEEALPHWGLSGKKKSIIRAHLSEQGCEDPCLFLEAKVDQREEKFEETLT